jgi:hypothetical protein
MQLVFDMELTAPHVFHSRRREIQRLQQGYTALSEQESYKPKQ